MFTQRNNPYCEMLQNLWGRRYKKFFNSPNFFAKIFIFERKRMFLNKKNINFAGFLLLT
jgi:hypothetical protein